jgi:hypothetical protein
VLNKESLVENYLRSSIQSLGKWFLTLATVIQCRQHRRVSNKFWHTEYKHKA